MEKIIRKGKDFSFNNFHVKCIFPEVGTSLCALRLYACDKREFLPVFGHAFRLVRPNQYGVHPFWLGTVVTAVSHGCDDEAINRTTRWQ